jgi:hypothetical protein
VYYSGTTEEHVDVFEMPVKVHPCHNDIRLPCRGSVIVSNPEGALPEWALDKHKIVAHNPPEVLKNQHLAYPLEMR